MPILAFHLVWDGASCHLPRSTLVQLPCSCPGFFCVCLLSHHRNIGIIDVNYQTQLYTCSEDPNSGSYVCTAKVIYILSNPPSFPALIIFKGIIQTIYLLVHSTFFLECKCHEQRYLHPTHHCDQSLVLNLTE